VKLLSKVASKSMKKSLYFSNIFLSFSNFNRNVPCKKIIFRAKMQVIIEKSYEEYALYALYAKYGNGCDMPNMQNMTDMSSMIISK
jgi:hypothetical protein